LTDEFTADDLDLAAVTSLLGRSPAARFAVAVRRPDRMPVVIRNAPSLKDGTPMPTSYWLVDPSLVLQVSRLESGGAVRRLEAEVDPDELAAAHAEYAAQRDLLVDPDAPRAPSGGVGGTRRGVKCLHAHLANFLVGADDPVGRRVATLIELGELVPPPPSHDRL
jgi:uncharacterized protein